MLSDVEKFLAIYHSGKFGSYSTDKAFCEASGINDSTLSGWVNSKIGRISKVNKQKLCHIWNLNCDVWTETFSNTHVFVQSLERFRQIEQPADLPIDGYIIAQRDETIALSKKEEKELETLSKQSVLSIPPRLQELSSDYLFAYAGLLKAKNQAYEALMVLEVIAQRKDTFYYYFTAPIAHLKAVLLSHKSIGRWDDAIAELQFLYKVLHYHIKEPEILTLLASNLKRKATYGNNNKPLTKEDVDTELLERTLTIYREAYRTKLHLHKQGKASEFYYDAVNIAYLEKILTVIGRDEPDDESHQGMKELVEDVLTMWKPDPDNWWEVISRIELLMLIGDMSRADSELESYAHTHTIEPFEVTTTRRQLEQYIAYTDDVYAKTLDSWLAEIEKAI